MIAVSDETVDYIARYGGMCRDCADEGGICPRSGLPCADRGKAIRHVLSALNYGLEHGFIKSASLSAAPVGGDALEYALGALRTIVGSAKTSTAGQLAAVAQAGIDLATIGPEGCAEMRGDHESAPPAPAASVVAKQVRELVRATIHANYSDKPRLQLSFERAILALLSRGSGEAIK